MCTSLSETGGNGEEKIVVAAVVVVVEEEEERMGANPHQINRRASAMARVRADTILPDPRLTSTEFVGSANLPERSCG